MKIVKAGNTELTIEQAQYCYENNLYVCNYSGVWQPFYSNAQQQYYFHKVITTTGYTKCGRFYMHNAETINHVLGKILIEN